MSSSLRKMNQNDRDEIARLIFHSTNRYYQSIGRQPIFQGDELSPAFIFDVYQELDPDHGLVVVESDRIIASCFVHPRSTHVSLGIMNVHPDHFGTGSARLILSRIIKQAFESAKPVRLVSSCLNLNSFSLYTKAGFVPFATFQDMLIEVPAAGLPPFEPAAHVRPATANDLDSIVELERNVSGIERRQDYEFMIAQPDELWHLSVIETPNQPGQLQGFLASCGSYVSNMLGPGCALDATSAAALLHTELNRYPGRTPVFLVPVDQGSLVSTLYSWGAKNVEMHVAQECRPEGSSLPIDRRPQGITFPTFLPESG